MRVDHSTSSNYITCYLMSFGLLLYQKKKTCHLKHAISPFFS